MPSALRFPLSAFRFFLLASILLLLSSCSGTRRDWSADEVSLVAWYIEDVAHGLPRKPDELATENPSEALKRIHMWAKPGDKDQPPRQLGSRRARWPALRGLLKEGVIACNDNGFLVVATKTSNDDVRLAKDLCAAENSDRQSIDLMVLSLSKTALDARAREYATTVSGARRKLDKP